MNESDFNEWLEASRAGRLSAADEAQLHTALRDHPEMMARWLDESRLNKVLDQLPDVPVASNFTVGVLAQVDGQPRFRMAPFWTACRVLLYQLITVRRLAAGTALVILLTIAWHQYTVYRRQQSSHDLVWLSFAASSVPEPSVFRDFDAIRRLRLVPPPTDDALYDVLTQ